MNRDDSENPNSTRQSLKTMFLAQAKARKAADKPDKKRPAKKPPLTAVESNAPSASVTENENERDSAKEIDSSAKERERDSGRDMELPASERERDSARDLELPASERDREMASTSAGNQSTKVACDPESIRSQSAANDCVTEGGNVSGSSKMNFYSAKNSSLAEQTPGKNY